MTSDGLPVSRRSLIRTAGAAGIAGLAGCTGGGGDGGGGGGGNGDAPSELKIGIQVPQSGPYGSSGQAVADAMKLAAQDAIEAGEFENIETSVKDTQTDPSTGRQKAQEHINDGADFLAGNISSATALSVGELAQRNDMVYNCVAGSNAVTGSECRKSTFAWSDSAVMQLGGALGYVLDNDVTSGNDIYIISADYAWGQSLAKWVEEQIAPANDLNVVGNEFTPFGNSDYSSQLTAARDADPDILMMNMSGTDEITSLPQTQEFGILEDTTVVYAATNLGDAQAIDQEILSHENYYSSIAWYWNYDYTDASKSFAERYAEEYPDNLRDAYIASFYSGVRVTLSAMAETGSTSLSDLQSEIEGGTIDPSLWGIEEESRACDHRATIATTTVTGKDPSEAEGQDLYEVVDVPSRETVMDRMRTCEQTGCQL
jgi:ABC-type branched-subunit amino acid transport system substrate-binding protein